MNSNIFLQYQTNAEHRPGICRKINGVAAYRVQITGRPTDEILF